MSDRLALANAIEEAGIERSKAERVASIIVAAIYDRVATKPDVQASETAARADIAALDARLFGEIRAVHSELTNLDTRLSDDMGGVRRDMTSLEMRLSGEIGAVRTDLVGLSSEISWLVSRALILFSGVMVVLFGILFTALKWHG